MTEAARRLLQKSEKAIEAARRLSDLPDSAAGRAYYAMFYVAEALLVDRGIRLRKHSAVHAAFGEHFAKSGAVDPKFHRWLLDAFDKRIQGDYGIEAVLTPEDVATMIDQAAELLREARRRLEPETTAPDVASENG